MCFAVKVCVNFGIVALYLIVVLPEHYRISFCFTVCGNRKWWSGSRCLIMCHSMTFCCRLTKTAIIISLELLLILMKMAAVECCGRIVCSMLMPVSTHIVGTVCLVL